MADLLPAAAAAPTKMPPTHAPASSAAAAAAAPPTVAPLSAPTHVGVVIEGRPKPPPASTLQGVVGSGSASVDAGTIRQVMELVLAQRGDETMAESMAVDGEEDDDEEGSSDDEDSGDDASSAAESTHAQEPEPSAAKKQGRRKVKVQDSSAQTGGVGGKAVSTKPAADSVEA